MNSFPFRLYMKATMVDHDVINLSLSYVHDKAFLATYCATASISTISAYYHIIYALTSTLSLLEAVFDDGCTFLLFLLCTHKESPLWYMQVAIVISIPQKQERF